MVDVGWILMDEGRNIVRMDKVSEMKVGGNRLVERQSTTHTTSTITNPYWYKIRLLFFPQTADSSSDTRVPSLRVWETTSTPAAPRAASFSAAVGSPGRRTAPAWPMTRPGGAR